MKRLLLVLVLCVSACAGEYRTKWIEGKATDNNAPAGHHSENSDSFCYGSGGTLIAECSLSATNTDSGGVWHNWAGASGTFVVEWYGSGSPPGGTITGSASVSVSSSASGDGNWFNGEGITIGVAAFGCSEDFGCRTSSRGAYDSGICGSSNDVSMDNMDWDSTPTPTEIHESGPPYRWDASISGDVSPDEDFELEVAPGCTYYCVVFAVETDCYLYQEWMQGYSASDSASSEVVANVSASFSGPE